MQFFSAQATTFSKKNFFAHENMKKVPSKVAHNWPQIVFSVLARMPRIDFSYHKYVPRLICLLICEWPIGDLDRI